MLTAIDIETKDPDLKEMGPGAVRDNGKILGVAFAYHKPDGSIESFYNITDDVLNMPTSLTLATAFEGDVVGANILYDLEWLCRGIKNRPKGKIIDIQLAERIINPNAVSVSLETLSQKYLKQGKASGAIDEWWDAMYPKKKGKAIENLDLVPVELVEKYAKQDVELTLKVWEAQQQILNQDKGLLEAFERESTLLPIILEMRYMGIPFTEDKSRIIEHDIDKYLHETDSHIREKLNITETLNIKKHEHKDVLASYCDSKGIKYKTTSGTKKPSFTKDWCKSQADPLFGLVAGYEEAKKLKGDFVVNIRKFEHKGKVYCCYHPFKSGGKNSDDDNGTITGRFSSTKPNMQQIPKRNKKFGNLIRSQFFAPEGYVWVKADYSQQEVRAFIDVACGYDLPEALEIRKRYIHDHKLDFYNVIVELCHAGGYDFVTRDDAKTLLLATQYGMGVPLLAVKLGLYEKQTVTQDEINNYRVQLQKAGKKSEYLLKRDDDYLKEILIREKAVAAAKKLSEAFHATFPFIKEMQRLISGFVKKNGYIDTIGKRKIPFEEYQIKLDWDSRQKIINDNEPLYIKELDLVVNRANIQNVYTMFELKNKYSDFQIMRYFELAFTYKALNYRVQGSCADITKQAMINCHRKGLTPLMQVHDELNFLIKDDEDLPNKLKVIKHEMENTFDISVPMLVDIEVGRSWGEVEKVEV